MKTNFDAVTNMRGTQLQEIMHRLRAYRHIFATAMCSSLSEGAQMFRKAASLLYTMALQGSCGHSLFGAKYLLKYMFLLLLTELFASARYAGLTSAAHPESETTLNKKKVHKGESRLYYIYGCLSLCKIFADLFHRQAPGCKHLSGVTLRWCAQMGIPRGEPQQMVGLSRPL